MAGIKCPNCRNKTSELMSCDNCNNTGCTRCVVKHRNQWLCADCKKVYSTYTVPSQSRSSGFPGWFG